MKFLDVLKRLFNRPREMDRAELVAAQQRQREIALRVATMNKDLAMERIRGGLNARNR